MANEIIVKIENLRFSFPDERGRPGTIGPLSFEARRGEFVSVIGPSGCGKSTLLRLIAGVIKPSGGSIIRRYAKRAMVFQNYALFPWLSALDNAAFGLQMGGLAKNKRRSVAQEKLREVGLAGLEHRFPHELSGGQSQRVGIARALSLNPELLLMDEPFSNLDVTTAKSLKQDILSLWSKYKMTVIMVNHLVPDAIELSDRVILLNGRPAKIALEKEIALPRPRNRRGPDFLKLEDAIEMLL